MKPATAERAHRRRGRGQFRLLRCWLDQKVRGDIRPLIRCSENARSRGRPCDRRGGPKKCEGTEGLIREGEKIVSAGGDPLAKDAALIAAAQCVEHYEIAGYGTASTLADQLGLDDAQDVLDQTLDEESNADKLLTRIATGGMFRNGINEQAAR